MSDFGHLSPRVDGISGNRGRSSFAVNVLGLTNLVLDLLGSVRRTSSEPLGSSRDASLRLKNGCAQHDASGLHHTGRGVGLRAGSTL
jgi:hypothetical protein